MAIALQKGSSFNLSKKEPALQKVFIGLGWEFKPNNYLDLDASVFMLANNRKLLADEYFVFYNNLKSPDGSIQHTGDNRTGIGDDDDEIILANLQMIHPNITEILIVVTIHEAAERQHTFGMLEDAYIRMVDAQTKREILRYDLDAKQSTATGVEFGKLHKENNEWYFTALGVGDKKDLQAYVNIYA